MPLSVPAALYAVVFVLLDSEFDELVLVFLQTRPRSLPGADETEKMDPWLVVLGMRMSVAIAS